MARKPKPPIDVALPDVTDSPATEDELSFLKFLEGVGQRVDTHDPMSDEGLRYQALYVSSFSQHPLDVLRRIMQNPYSDPKDRISAAAKIMDFSMRKPTQSLNVNAKGAAIAIEPSKLAALSTKELEALEQLLEKIA